MYIRVEVFTDPFETKGRRFTRRDRRAVIAMKHSWVEGGLYERSQTIH